MKPGRMHRRELLLLPTGSRNRGRDESSAGDVELSCEQLYMRFVDARAGEDGEAFTRLSEMLAHDCRSARRIHLTDTSWLADKEFNAWLRAELATLQRAQLIEPAD